MKVITKLILVDGGMASLLPLRPRSLAALSSWPHTWTWTRSATGLALGAGASMACKEIMNPRGELRLPACRSSSHQAGSPRAVAPEAVMGERVFPDVNPRVIRLSALLQPGLSSFSRSLPPTRSQRTEWMTWKPDVPGVESSPKVARSHSATLVLME